MVYGLSSASMGLSGILTRLIQNRVNSISIVDAGYVRRLVLMRTFLLSVVEFIRSRVLMCDCVELFELNLRQRPPFVCARLVSLVNSLVVLDFKYALDIPLFVKVILTLV